MNKRCYHAARCALFCFSWTIAAIGSSLTTGCSMIGFAVGSAIDSGLEWDTMATGDAASLVKGQDVSIRLVEHRTVEGSFLRRDTLSMEAYIPVYEESIRNLESDVVLPQVGDSITIVPRSDGNEIRATFLGFSERGIRVAAPPLPMVRLVPLGKIHHIELRNGLILAADQLSALLKEGKIPYRTGLWLEVDSVPRRFSSEGVETIMVRHESNLKAILGVTGLIIDVVIVIALTTENWFPEWDQPLME